MKRIGMGIVGAGFVGPHHVDAVRRLGFVDVVAVAGSSEASAKAKAEALGARKAYGSYEALLDDPDVEAVYISLPNAMHVGWSLRALEAGTHVLCEKPFSRHPEEVEQAFDLAGATGLVLSEGFMWRHHPQTAKLVELVADGAIGPLRVVRAAFSFQLAAVHGAGDTRFDPDLDGGSLMDVGSYCLSAIRLLAGEPERLQGQQVVGPSGVDVCFAASLALPDDRLGHFDCGFVLPSRGELEVVGEEASLFVDDPFHARAPGIELRRQDGTERIVVERANSYRLELENVADAIRGEGPLLLGREDALGQARAIDALYRSASTTDGSAS